MSYKLGRQYSTTNAVTFPGIIEVQRERRFIKKKGKLLQYFKQGYFNKQRLYASENYISVTTFRLYASEPISVTTFGKSKTKFGPNTIFQ